MAEEQRIVSMSDRDFFFHAILAGAIVGSLFVISLQLRRIADALESKPTASVSAPETPTVKD